MLLFFSFFKDMEAVSLLAMGKSENHSMINFGLKDDLQKVLKMNCDNTEDLVTQDAMMKKHFLLLEGYDKRMKQLALLKPNFDWDKIRNSTIGIESLHFETWFEAVFKFGLRREDGYGGFYNQSVHGIKPSPDGMFKASVELKSLVEQFPKRGKGRMMGVLKTIEHELDLDVTRMKDICHALEQNCFHVMMPGELEELINTLEWKNPSGKFAKLFLQVLKLISDAMDSWATVNDDQVDGDDFTYYVIRPEVVSILQDDFRQNLEADVKEVNNENVNSGNLSVDKIGAGKTPLATTKNVAVSTPIKKTVTTTDAATRIVTPGGKTKRKLSGGLEETPKKGTFYKFILTPVFLLLNSHLLSNHIGKSKTAGQRFLEMKTTPLKENKGSKYRKPKDNKQVTMSISHLVKQVDGSWNVMIAVDFVMTRGQKTLPMFAAKVDYFAKLCEIRSALGHQTEGGFSEQIYNNFVNIYSSRAEPGSDDNAPKFTDINKRYNHRILAGVFQFHGVDADDPIAVAKELDSFKKNFEDILTDDAFPEDFVLGAWAYIARRDSSMEEIKDEIVQFNGELEDMYKSDPPEGAMFNNVWKTSHHEITAMKKVPVVIKRDVALDEIFLDGDACALGSELYGIFSEKYKHVLMKYPTKKNRRFIKIYGADRDN